MLAGEAAEANAVAVATAASKNEAEARWAAVEKDVAARSAAVEKEAAARSAAVEKEAEALRKRCSEAEGERKTLREQLAKLKAAQGESEETKG